MAPKLILALILAVAVAPGVSGPVPSRAERPEPDPRLEALDLLHDGRFDEADERLQGALRVGHADASIDFFRAFVTYWRLLYDSENPHLLGEFEERIVAAVASAERELETSDGGPDAALWAGSARLLLAQLRATQKKPFGAAFEARRARRHLRSAAEGNESAEPDFGLGTYNYMADRVPAIVKGVRALLFLPGGDRREGLGQLERAARSSRFFALEARILLATIYSNRHERMYSEALRQAELAVAEASGAVSALHAAAVMDLGLGRPWHAVIHLDRALERMRRAPHTDPSVVGTIVRLRAQADFDLFRPDLCLERLRPVLDAPARYPNELVEEARGLAVSASRLVRGGTPARDRAAPVGWRKALPSLELESGGRGAEALASILRAAEEAPVARVLALLAGRALVLAGRGPEGLEHLRRAEASGELPDPWLGPCRLLAGQAADLAGLRPLAVSFYSSALGSPPFRARDAADFHREVPYQAGT